MEVAHPEFNRNYMGLNWIISDYLVQIITRQRQPRFTLHSNLMVTGLKN